MPTPCLITLWPIGYGVGTSAHGSHSSHYFADTCKLYREYLQHEERTMKFSLYEVYTCGYVATVATYGWKPLQTRHFEVATSFFQVATCGYLRRKFANKSFFCT